MIILTVISVFAWTVIEKRKEEILALFGVKVDTFFVKLGSIIMEIVILILKFKNQMPKKEKQVALAV